MGAKVFTRAAATTFVMARIWVVHVKALQGWLQIVVQRDSRHVDTFFRRRFVSWSKQPRCLSTETMFFFGDHFFNVNNPYMKQSQHKITNLSFRCFFCWWLKPNLIHRHHAQPPKFQNLRLLRKLWPLVVGPLDEFTQQILHEKSRKFSVVNFNFDDCLTKNRILPTAWGRSLSWDLASSLQPWILDAHEIFAKTETPPFFL